MRKVLLTVALVALLALPLFAQFGRIGGGKMDATALISNKSVQDELKLDDDQKKMLKDATDARNTGFREAFQEEDKQAAFKKVTEEFTKSVKKVLDKLSDKQTKRLTEIEIQVATKGKNPTVFTNATVQKELKLTSKQKDTIKDAITDMEKDFKELDDDAKGDFKKMGANFKKKQEMSGDVYGKITKALSDDQTKTLEKLGGDKFELKQDFGGFGKDKKGKGGKNKKDKKDDF